jgi:hypothetical protein
MAVPLWPCMELHSRHILHQLVSICFLLLERVITGDAYHELGCRVPNFILAFIPAQINANTLNTMTAFAVCESVALSHNDS